MNKAFDEWWKKAYQRRLPIGNKTAMEIAEESWHAALNWVLDSAGGGCDWDKIEEELDGK